VGWRLFPGEVANPLWQRARRVRVYDRDGSVGRIQWAGAGLAYLALFLLVIFEPRSIDDDDVVVTFLGLAYVALAVCTVIFAGTSLVGDRRRGFLEQILVTPMTSREILDGTLLAVGQHLFRLVWLPALLGVFFVLTGALQPWNLAASLLTAFLILALFAVQGVGCSLLARTMPGALLPSLVFALVLTLGTLLLADLFRLRPDWMLPAGAILLLLAGHAWVRRRPTPASFTVLFTGLHLTIALAATIWTWEFPWREFPFATVNALYWPIALLMRDQGSRLPEGAWVGALICYWFALIVSTFLMRLWLIRNFDRLEGRIE
jgi:hypothetical protein